MPEEIVAVVPEKKWWQSKTAWVNVLVGGLAAFFPESLGAFLTEGNVIMLLSVVNLVLRAVSKDAIAREIL